MERSTKRRYAPSGSDRNRGAMKRSRGGNQGRWQTPKQKAMQLQRGSIEVGDMGIWVTCARQQEGKAAREVQLLFDEYAELMYGVQQPGAGADSDDDESNDIEASIKKELGAMGQRKTDRPFSNVRVNAECVLFTKVRAPIEPVAFVQRICRDAAAAGAATGAEKTQTLTRGTRYVNRMTPISRCGKATERGVELLARIVLAPYFELKPDVQAVASKGDENTEEPQGEADAQSEAKTDEHSQTLNGDQTEEKPEKPAYTYAIRPTLRNHRDLKRDGVIKSIASLIKDQHKVNLGKPDKVILVDIYQTICGISVVDGDWDSLKRYNLNELYHPSEKPDQKSDQKPDQKPDEPIDETASAPAEEKPEEIPASGIDETADQQSLPLG